MSVHENQFRSIFSASVFFALGAGSAVWGNHLGWAMTMALMSILCAVLAAAEVVADAVKKG